MARAGGSGPPELHCSRGPNAAVVVAPVAAAPDAAAAAAAAGVVALAVDAAAAAVGPWCPLRPSGPEP